MAIDAVLVGTGHQSTSGASTTTASGTTAASGSTFVAVYSWGGGSAPTSVTDNKGNTYTQRGAMMDNYGGGMRSMAFVKEDGAGGSGHTVTVAVSAGATDSTLRLIEITGALAASLDLYPDGTHDTATPYVASSGTLGQADELVLSCCATDTSANPTVYACTDFTLISTEVNSALYWGNGIAKKVVSATTSVTASWTSSGATAGYVHILTFKAASSATIDQEGFRFYEDGSEAGATALAAQDTNVTSPIGTNIILRALLNATDDPSSTAYQLEFRKSGETPYVAVPVGSARSAPTYQDAGAGQGSAADITVPWPTHAIDDIGLLIIESTGGQAASLSTSAGFAAVTNSPSSTGTTTNGTRLTAYWCRATSAAMSSPVVTDPGNHVYGQILTFRGCVATGDPWDVTAAAQKASASTSASAPAVTTTVANCLIVNCIARDNDSASDAFSSWTNANLASITEVAAADAGTAQGNGGGIGVAYGVKVAAGDTGDTTATVTSSINASLTIALKPLDPSRIYVSPSASITASGENTTARLTAPSGKTTGDFVAGRIADDENPIDAVNITADDYTEVAWSLNAQSPAVNTDVYQFRITAAGTPIDTYSVTPQWTIGTAGGASALPNFRHHYQTQGIL